MQIPEMYENIFLSHDNDTLLLSINLFIWIC